MVICVEMVYVMQIIQLLIGSYIQKDKVASNEGDSFVFELAERAEDEAFKKKLQDFIKKVKPFSSFCFAFLTKGSNPTCALWSSITQTLNLMPL